MKFYALAALVPAAYASTASDFCSRDGATDVDKCEEVVQLARCSHSDEACMGAAYQAWLNEGEDTASDEYINDEFFSTIEEDPLMQEVMGNINQNQVVLSASGFVEATEEEPAHIDEDAVDESATRTLSAGGANATMTLPQLGELSDTQNQLKRFVELKQLVSWMQPKDKRISRYCFYGCWCLPEGAHSFIAGEGHPVDLVDRACQLFWFCYQCAKQEFATNILGKDRVCQPEKTKYTFRFKYNKRKPNDYKARDIVCKDNWYNPMNTRDKWKSNCAKAFCECDRGIAMRLYKSWKHWDKSRHRIWSQRVTECPRATACANMPTNTAKQRSDREKCLRVGCLFKVDERCLYGAGGNNEEDSRPICCGIYEDDGARWEMRDHGGRYACCNHDFQNGFGDKLPWNGAWFNTITHCCKDGQVESSGNC